MWLFYDIQRKQTLLKEMHQRNKVGGIVDRRFGEADPTMAPEEKMLQRFMKEKQRNFKNNAMFNLEDDQEDAQLTHFGQALSLGKDVAAEIDGSESSGDDEESGSDANPRKRKRLFEPDAGDGEEDEDSLSTRPKSRKEMLHEVMAKSKLHKYERQQAKEDDEDEREKLDQELPELLAIMKGRLQLPGGPQMHQNPLDDQPEQPAQARASDLTKNQQYDKQLREMVLDRRSRPTDKTKTEEEKAQEKADHLHALEEQRLRRMRGEVLDEEEEPDDQVAGGQQGTELDDAQMFGLGSGIAGSVSKPDRGVEDEDDFILDDDLIASDSAPDISDDSEAASHSEDPGDADDDDREFIGDLANDDIRPRLTAVTGASEKGETEYPLRCYPCPQSHAEFRETVRGIPQQELPMVVRRIRALYSAELDSDNKRKLGVFATVLVTHIAYLADQPRHPPMAAVEQLIRHIHSLAKTYPIEVAEAFRKRLRSLHEERPTAPTPGDLVVFMAIQAIFPTSDHFHQVVTPAMLSMARYLSQKRPTNLSDLVTGSCIGTLCLQYQSLAKRYVPELLNYALNGIIGLAPTKIKILPNSAPQFELPRSLRIQGKLSKEPRRLRFWDVLPQALSEDEEQLLKESLLHTFLFLVNEMAKLWSFHAAFIDAFDPVQDVLQQVQKPKCQEKLGPLKDVRDIPSASRPMLILLLASLRNHQDHRDTAESSTSATTTVGAPPTSSAGDQDIHPQIRRVVQPGQALRPRPRAARAQQAQGRTQARTEGGHAGTAQGRQLHRA